jgi:Cu/Ag efflux pump CusA
LTVNIDRGKIARYGLNISDVQNVIEIAVAGNPHLNSMKRTGASTSPFVCRKKKEIPSKRSKTYWSLQNRA